MSHVVAGAPKFPPISPDGRRHAAQSKQGKPSALDVVGRFDAMPDAAFVRQPVVQLLVGASPSSLWRMVKAGRLPAPHRISEGITAWNVGELREGLAALRGTA